MCGIFVKKFETLCRVQRFSERPHNMSRVSWNFENIFSFVIFFLCFFSFNQRQLIFSADYQQCFNSYLTCETSQGHAVKNMSIKHVVKLRNYKFVAGWRRVELSRLPGNSQGERFR